MRSRKTTSFPLVGEAIPAFTAETTKGTLRVPEDFKGRWLVLFSHPAAFTPVCTTEFIAFAKKQQAFNDLDTELVGLSTDPLYKTNKWVASMNAMIADDNLTIDFPIIADADMTVAQQFGMIHPQLPVGQTVRAVFIIDPQGIVQGITYYPYLTGRNVDEFLRHVHAIQRTQQANVATPVNWQPGDDLIALPQAEYPGDVKTRLNEDPTIDVCHDWYYCTKKDIESR